jgi:glutamate synthase (NADPH/NADH) small chain
MGQPKPPCQNPKERLSNTREVSLGFTKKISSEEARRCPQCAEPTCLSGCPLGIDIPGFIRFLREGDAVSALERIKQANPFPAICGRICPAPCERACIFEEDGAPIAIRTLERYASDNGSKSKNKISVTLNGKSVAIVGSGPAAMAAASVLLKVGFKVVMYEAANEPGGILRYGVPAFRLPQDILNDQFDDLRTLGLELLTNQLIGRMTTIDELARAFDAVLLSTGASLPDFASIEGENYPGVYYAEEFLMRTQLLTKEHIVSSSKSLWRGTHTLVVGSGYAALDAARVALRLGQETSLVFGGLEEELDVPAFDIQEALEEGLKILTPFEPIKIVADEQGILQGVQCRRLEIVEGKESLTLKAAAEEPVLHQAQTVILANSQKANPFLSKVTPLLKVNADGTVWVNPQTGLTSLDKIFAQGAAAAGPINVVQALARGKAVAQQIMEYLK